VTSLLDMTTTFLCDAAPHRNRPTSEPDMTTSSEGSPIVSAGAQRMRWYRERRRRGLTCIKVDLRRSEVDALIARGWLKPAEWQDRSALAAALHRYLDHNPIAGRGW